MSRVLKTVEYQITTGTHKTGYDTLSIFSGTSLSLYVFTQRYCKYQASTYRPTYIYIWREQISESVAARISRSERNVMNNCYYTDATRLRIIHFNPKSEEDRLK